MGAVDELPGRRLEPCRLIRDAEPPLNLCVHIQGKAELLINQRKDPEDQIFPQRERLAGQPFKGPEIPRFEVCRSGPHRALDVRVIERGVRPSHTLQGRPSHAAEPAGPQPRQPETIA